MGGALAQIEARNLQHFLAIQLPFRYFIRRSCLHCTRFAQIVDNAIQPYEA